MQSTNRISRELSVFLIVLYLICTYENRKMMETAIGKHFRRLENYYCKSTRLMAQWLSIGSFKKVYANTIKLLVIVAVCISLPGKVNGQSYLEPFGQNRIQYRKFQWKYFDTKHFRVYHYDRQGRQLGRYVAEEAEDDIKYIEHKLGGQFPKRFNIILYNSYDEYRQTNVGLKDEAQGIGNSKAGTVDLVGDKLVVYFTGQHGDLQHQIRTGMARVVMERMIFGDNLKKMVKNALTLNLPEWVTTGYIAYLVDGWDAKSSSQWKGLIDDRPDAGFYQLSEQYPELAGKAFWKFIANQYGPGTVKNLLYSMQKKTSLNKAMKDKGGLGLKITDAYDSCMNFYKNVYALDALKQEKPDSTKGLIALKVPKDNSIIKEIRVSPRGSDICYVVWKDGEYTVYDQKTAKEQEVATLLQGGQKDLTEQIDPNYPMIAWSNTGYKMAILYKKGHTVRLKIYNSLKGRINDYVIPKNRFDRVLGMSFGTDQDEDKLVFSAIKKSQTDLYMFTLKGSKMTNITDDVWDDVSPQFISGGSRTGILFLSNRPKPNLNVPQEVNELPTGPMNVFFYNTKTMSTELLQLSDVKKGVITQPIQYGTDNFAYLCDSNGIDNKYVVLFAHDSHKHDSAYSVPITNYSTSILSQQYNLASGDVADVIQVKDKYMVYFHELQMPGVNAKAKELSPTTLSGENDLAYASNPGAAQSSKSNHKHKYTPKEEDEITDPEIKGGNAFQSEFADDTAAPQPKHRSRSNPNNIYNANVNADSSMLSVITDSSYLNMKPASYKLSFKPDLFNVKLDNSVLFSQYQSIAANGGQYVNPSLSGLITVSLDELMEDYKINAGFQLPIDGSATTYFLQYQNNRRIVDWGLLLLRSTNKSYENVGYLSGSQLVYEAPELFRSSTNLVQSDFSYPLDRVRSIHFHTGVMQARSTEKVTDTLSLIYNLNMPVVYTSISRLEYIFDNTTTPVLNISNGTKFKIYGEELYGLGPGNPSCYNLGVDIRNYTKLYKNFILANRLAYAHSDGSSEVEYLLGGVDDWVSPKQADNAGQPPAPNYGFQAMETTLRGYDQYARVGNNFFVFNTELRLPVLTTILNKPIQSSILKNLQVVAFVDMGDAWNGFLPTTNNLSSTYSYPQYITPNGLNNVFLTLTVPNNDGLAVGYGGGLRTSILGYFLRLDAAWNIEGIKKPVIYFALGTDF